MSRIKLLCFGLLLGAILMAKPVLAHNETVDDAILVGIGSAYGGQVIHYDDDPYKGWFNLTVLNDSGAAWGDFHFQLFEVTGGSALANVFFSDEYTSTSTQGATGLISPDGNALDFIFYGNPVLDGQYASFNVYTDNTAGMLNFGIGFYATPVPVPAAFWLMGSGLLFVVGRKARIKA